MSHPHDDDFPRKSCEDVSQAADDTANFDDITDPDERAEAVMAQSFHDLHRHLREEEAHKPAPPDMVDENDKAKAIVRKTFHELHRLCREEGANGANVDS